MDNHPYPDPGPQGPDLAFEAYLRRVQESREPERPPVRYDPRWPDLWPDAQSDE